jgi:large subunit ribosomal protein L32
MFIIYKMELNPMAVQKSKKTPSRIGMRRSHSKLKKPSLALEPTTGEVVRRHHISSTGFYKGKQFIEQKVDEKVEETQ